MTRSEMNTMHKFYAAAIAAAFTLAIATSARADEGDDGAYLDKRYPVSHPAVDLESIEGFARDVNAPLRSDFTEMATVMSPVKSQASRGACSIFSATAMLESMLVRQGYVNEAPDLSEEWLEYLATRYASEDGSFAFKNFQNLVSTGFAEETLAPYETQDWTENPSALTEIRCGNLTGARLTSCLIGHWDPKLLELQSDVLAQQDPDFLRVRRSARDNRDEYLTNNMFSNKYSVGTIQEVKESLRRGIPVVMEMDFYYGAWNHRLATELGIGRNMDHWNAGIVGYPEPGSMDREKSGEKPAGHSVLVVGYDDERIIETRVLMEDGSTRTFRYKGVYYFKNSWGTAAFGKDQVLDGVPAAGYGVVTYRYANEYGSFYRFPLRAAQSN